MKSIEEKVLLAVLDGDIGEARRLLAELTTAECQQLAEAAQRVVTLSSVSLAQAN